MLADGLNYEVTFALEEMTGSAARSLGRNTPHHATPQSSSGSSNRTLIARLSTSSGQIVLLSCRSDEHRPETIRQANGTSGGELHLHRPQNLHQNFQLRDGSRSYNNVLRFLLAEMQSRLILSALDGIDATLKDLLPDIAKYCSERLGEPKSRAREESLRHGPFEVLDIFRSDLDELDMSGEATPEMVRAENSLGYYANRTEPTLTGSETQQIRVFADGSPEPVLFSGLLRLGIAAARTTNDLDGNVVSESEFNQKKRPAALEGCQFLSAAIVKVNGCEAEVAVKAYIPKALAAEIDLYVHCGREDLDPRTGKKPLWCDYELPESDLTRDGEGTIEVQTKLRFADIGSYGLTAAIVSAKTGERLWLADENVGDTIFKIEIPAPGIPKSASGEDIHGGLEVRAHLLKALRSYDRFVNLVYRLVKDGDERGVGRHLFEITGHDRDLSGIVEDYFQKLVVDLGSKRTGVAQRKLETVLTVMQTAGLGEIVFVSPEGHHAIAGGLAQVIVGLSDTLSRTGLPITIITPLYEQSQGSKHASAEEIIAHGVNIKGKMVPVVPNGSIKLPLGPTLEPDTGTVLQFPRVLHVDIYQAHSEGVKILFLRHNRLASRLYPRVFSDDELRRGVFLSRGALEVIADERFGLRPQIIVTNDWLTALVPVYLRTDPRYRDHMRLGEAKLVHMLHNCGRNYQGRFLKIQFGQDIWPLLGLSPEHAFGLSDPIEPEFLNLTAGAVFHTRDALLTVSKPYAEQLTIPGGGDGLGGLFAEKRERLFGISNGVDLRGLRRSFWTFGEMCLADVEDPALQTATNRSESFTDELFLKRLERYKRAAKQVIQKRYQLEVNENAVLITLVGRLAEQKGLQLLTDPLPGTASLSTASLNTASLSTASLAGRGQTVLESVLTSYPEAQVFIGGPITEGDPTVEALQIELSRLRTLFPTRVACALEFIPHAEALQVTQASDLFLMPSKYEPGGITQLEALATGTMVVARNIGGIGATIKDYNEEQKLGQGFLFDEFHTEALLMALTRGVQVISMKDARKRLVKDAALSKNDWTNRIQKYLALFQYISGVLEEDRRFPYLMTRLKALRSIRAGG